MIRGMAGMTPTMVPAPDPSRTGDILIVKGQPSGCPFCMLSLVQAGKYGKDPLPAGSGTPDAGEETSLCFTVAVVVRVP